MLEIGSNSSIRCTGCSGWVHKRCSGVKGSLARVVDTFVCKVCERAEDAEDTDADEGMDLGNGVCIENVRKFCYLGDMVNGGGGANSASVARVRCAWGKFRENVWDPDKEGSVAKDEGVCGMCEECYGVWK